MNTHRLPRGVAPEHYDLTFTLDIEGSSFAGEERVQVQVHEPTPRLVLNAADLDILDAELVADDGTVLAGRPTVDPEHEQVVIELDGTAGTGAHTLHLTFAGRFSEKLQGIYRSNFTDEDGRPQALAATQFEPADARRAFPCWDEPDFKATFAVTLICDKALAAISNSEVSEETELGNGRKQVRFAPTMRMSSYLVAFVVGPLETTVPVAVDGVPLRVACVPGKLELSGFSLEIGAHALRYFSRYFGVPYPAGKLDLIALPDFAMGAMENLGAVTFREALLLVDPDRATRSELERVADVVAHELAHMWFGDLVTMRWWNGIWLNEAFATFMELLCIDDFRPDWQRWVTFALSRGHAMLVDGLASTRAIEFPVDSPDEAEQMFDVLTYQKGAGVLRMLEMYVGAEPFRNGIAAYIAEHSYDNTDTSDLWDALEASTGEPVRSTMDSWIYQPGYPLVSVASGAGGREIALSQRRFRYLDDGDSGGDNGDTSAAAAWQVPVMLRASVKGETLQQRVLLGPDTTTVDLGGPADWVVVNEGGWGFYRARYDKDLLAGLTGAFTSLDALERFNLVSDTWAAVLAGASPVEDFLALATTASESGETDPSVWSAIAGALSFLDRMLPLENRAPLQEMVKALLSPLAEELGWSPAPGETERTGTLRATVLSTLGILGADAAVVAQARELHARELAEPGSVDADVAAAVVTIVAVHGDEADYAVHLDRYKAAATPQEEVRYLYSLASFEDEALVKRTLDLAMGDEVRTQNAPFLISQLIANRRGGALAWAAVKEQWDELIERIPDKLVDRMLEGVTALSVPEVAADVRSFLEAHPAPSRQRTVAQLLERLDIAVAFRRREAASLPATLARL
ncbi:MAG TPA: M1 family metallopeptidase [Acidimicrobiales bacterium]|nr:M1 family metallopeptidase [Acidimicrobiales bacterium]